MFSRSGCGATPGSEAAFLTHSRSGVCSGRGDHAAADWHLNPLGTLPQLVVGHAIERVIPYAVSLFCRDRINTGAAAPLTVVSSPAERFRFEPNTSAQVAKQKQETLIRLNSGAVEFQTAGATSAELPGGLSVRPTASKITVALVNRMANGNARVAVYKGAVEIAAANEKMMVSAGHTALVRPSANLPNNNQNKKNRKKKAWAIFITTGLSAGAVGAVPANVQSLPVDWCLPGEV